MTFCIKNELVFVCELFINTNMYISAWFAIYIKKGGKRKEKDFTDRQTLSQKVVKDKQTPFFGLIIVLFVLSPDAI